MTTRPSGAPHIVSGAAVRKPNRLWRLAFGAALAAQLIAVYAPDGPGGPEINGLDKVIHVLIFAVPALAALMVGIRARWSWPTSGALCSAASPTWCGVAASTDKVCDYPMATAHTSVTDTAVENHRALPDSDRYLRPAGRSHHHRA